MFIIENLEKMAKKKKEKNYLQKTHHPKRVPAHTLENNLLEFSCASIHV